MTAVLERRPDADGERPRPAEAVIARQRRPEPFLLGIGFLAFYEVVGWWLRDVAGYAVGDAIARSANAVYVGSSRDPHLAAIGFYWPPLSSLLQIPFVKVLHHFGRSDLAGPITSAACMAAAVVVIHAVCRDLGLPRALATAVPAIFGLTPVIVFYAANGMSEASCFLCLAVGSWGLIRYCRDRRATDMALMASGFGLAAMARVECIGVAVVAALFATVEVRGLPGSAPRSLTRAALAALPPVYLFAMWMGVQWVLLRDPFFFLHTAGQAAKTIGFANTLDLRNNPAAAAYLLPEARSKLKVAGWLLEQYWFFGPTLFLGAAYALARRSRARVPLALLASGTVFVVIQIPYRLQGKAYNDPRYFTPLAVMGALTAAWLLAEVWRSEPRRTGLRNLATVVIIGSMVAGAVAGTVAEANPRRAKVVREDTFFARVLGRSRPYVYAGEWTGWQRVAATVDGLLAAHPASRVICNASKCNPAVAFARRTNRYIVAGDRDYQSIVADPAGRFDIAITVGAGDPIAALLTPAPQWQKVLAVQLTGLSDNGVATVWRHVPGP